MQMAVIFELLKNRYAQLLLTIVISLILGFTSGYSYKSDKVELERLQQFELIQGKLDKVFSFSMDQAMKAQESSQLLEGQLETILGKVKGKPLSNVPCVPSDEFKDAWRKLDENTNN